MNIELIITPDLLKELRVESDEVSKSFLNYINPILDLEHTKISKYLSEETINSEDKFNTKKGGQVFQYHNKV